MSIDMNDLILTSPPVPNADLAVIPTKSNTVMVDLFDCQEREEMVITMCLLAACVVVVI